MRCSCSLPSLSTHPSSSAHAPYMPPERWRLRRHCNADRDSTRPVTHMLELVVRAVFPQPYSGVAPHQVGLDEACTCTHTTHGHEFVSTARVPLLQQPRFLPCHGPIQHRYSMLHTASAPTRCSNISRSMGCPQHAKQAAAAC